MTLIPVLEIGGTHVTSARVDAATMQVEPGSRQRHPVDGRADAEEILAVLATAANAVADGAARDWGVAIPGPFDYSSGVAWFEGVGKFDALHGVEVGARLGELIHPAPRHIRFLNDADAFVLGEWVGGALTGLRRCAGLTLGSGVGSGFVVDGAVVLAGPGVPPQGSAHLLFVHGRPLEETVSRRAIRQAYAAATGAAATGAAATGAVATGAASGQDVPDVAEITELASRGSAVAARVLDDAMHGLGYAIGPYFDRFQPEAVVIGGAMARSWPLFQPSFARGCVAAGAAVPQTVVAGDGESAGLRGAAYHCRSQSSDAG